MEHKHKHKWQIDRLSNEPANYGSTNMKDVAYLVCPECGSVIKQDILAFKKYV